MDKIYIGIDPGKSGGICFLMDDEIKTFKCPATTHDMAEELILAKDIRKCTAVVERVHSFPGQGVASTFNFGYNYGVWLGILSALHIPYQLCLPRKWMKFYGSMPKEKKDRKNHLKQLAQQMYPDHKVTLYNADAILLANYLKKTDI
tara:strand:+ start:2559 stop:2999 length:441 start_codon:yes stop_codon:yes gene_type:complete